MNRRLKLALKQSFTPPPALHKESFIQRISYPKAPFRKVLVSQITFIRKRVWFSFILCVCFAFFYTTYAEVPEHIVWGMSAILPLFSLCTVTEICKSTAYNMEETELACKYNLPKIILMRIEILGIVSFSMLVLFIILLRKSSFGMFRNIIYISVPYLLSNSLSLLTISKLRSKEAIYICAVISGAISLFILASYSNYSFIYNANFTFIWVVTFTIFAGLLFYSLIGFTKSQEELQWNSL